MNIEEAIGPTKGTLHFTVYEGDVEYGERIIKLRRHEEEDGRVIFVPERNILNPVVYQSPEISNLVTTNGKQLILNRLFGIVTVPNAIDATNGNMGVGTVATAAAVGDTQLNQGGGGSAFLRVFDATFPSRSAQVVTTQTTYATTEANFNWQECGLFNGPTNGTSTLFDRIAPIGAFNKTSAVSIIVQITVTQN